MFGWGMSWFPSFCPRCPTAQAGHSFVSTTDFTCHIGDAQDSHQEVYDNDGGYNQPDHNAKFSHELVAGAASFEGMKLFEDHQRKEGKYLKSPKLEALLAHDLLGKPVSHAFAKELLAGFAGGEVDKLAETHGKTSVSNGKTASLTPFLGMNEYDKMRAHHQAKENAQNLYDQHYGGSDEYNPNQQAPPQNLGYRREGRYGGDGGYGGGRGGDYGGDSGY